MENLPPSTTASTWLNRRPATVDERDTEISKLKERLGFYESFDQIIQDNVARAGELLRHAATMRENAEESLSIAKQEMEESRVSERQDFRALLSGLLDDVTSMQVQVERLARKVADALDDIELSLPAGVEFDRLPTDLPDPVPAIAADAGSEPWSSLTLDPTPDEIGPAETQDTEAAAMGTAATAAEDEPSEIEADIAAAEATELSDTAEYLATESASLEVESFELEATVDEPDSGHLTGEAADEPNDSVLQTDTAEAVESETDDAENAAAVYDGYSVIESEPPIDSLPVDGDTAAAESYESDAIAAEAAEAGSTLSAIDGLDADVSAGIESHDQAADAPSEESPAVSSDETEDVAVSAPSEPETAEAPAIAATDVEPEPEPEPIAAAFQPPVTRSDIRPFPAGGLGSAYPRPGTGELRAQEPARYAAPTMVALGSRGVGTVVLVHGVPRATTALSLKRFLESLPHVASVEPREYAEGVLRLHVTAQRPVLIDDLRGWSDGAGFEPVHLREDLVEVRLPH